MSDSEKQSEWIVDLDRAVQKYYDTKLKRDRIILNEIDFHLRPGEFCSVVGPSGCGKSTLLRLILGSEKAKGGTVKMFGAEPEPPNRDRGIVYQRYSLFPNMQVIDNVIFGLELDEINFLMKWIWYPGFRKKHAYFRKIGYEYLEQVGLSEHAFKYPYQLSGGQQQRVAIAQALIMKPKVLLMDEPFGALDPGTREELQNWLIEIQAKENISVFFVTHDLDEAVYLSSRVIVLSQNYLLEGKKSEGSKIVADLKVPGFPTEGYRNDPTFCETVETILQSGFHERSPIDSKDFIRTHPDSIL